MLIRFNYVLNIRHKPCIIHYNVLPLHCHYRGSDKDGKDEPLTKIEMPMKKKVIITVWFVSIIIDLSKVIMIRRIK